MWRILFSFFAVLLTKVNALSLDPGKFHYEIRNKTSDSFLILRALFNDSEIQLHVSGGINASFKVEVQVMCAEIECWPETPNWDTAVRKYMNNLTNLAPECNFSYSDHPESVNKIPSNITIKNGGIYVFNITIMVKGTIEEPVYVNIEMKQKNGGYLSAIDRPLLDFYGAMCIVYILFGISWLITSSTQWRDLLRIQFWIGAVILLGMLEMMVFFAEYDTINNNGENLFVGTVLIGEWISCLKRTLARMLVIIVSFGFGIVKPRLGPYFHRIVFIGGLYFIAAAWEAISRGNSRTNQSATVFASTVALAILDSLIFWWVFSNLVQTTRTLRLRRNVVKLALYNYFTNVLVVAVFISVIFMLYAIKERTEFNCIKNWDRIWIDAAFWHALFSIILLVIMILWRPTKNNRRYAFSLLLDAADDYDDDEDIERFVNDAYGVKMRGYCRSGSPTHNNNLISADDDLKWVEENIPSSILTNALPILDSDEEAVSSKFEISKME